MSSKLFQILLFLASFTIFFDLLVQLSKKKFEKYTIQIKEIKQLDLIKYININLLILRYNVYVIKTKNDNNFYLLTKKRYKDINNIINVIVISKKIVIQI